MVLSSADTFFFKISLYVVAFFFSKKNLSGISVECQAVWIQIMPYVCQASPGSKLFVKVISRRH